MVRGQWSTEGKKGQKQTKNWSTTALVPPTHNNFLANETHTRWCDYQEENIVKIRLEIHKNEKVSVGMNPFKNRETNKFKER